MAADTPEKSENAPPGETGVLAYAGRLSLWGYFVKCLKKCVDFRGRARRREFWAFALFFTLFSASVIFAGGMRVPEIFTLIFALPGAAALVRRLHDTGKSGWHILMLAAIPPGGICLSAILEGIGVRYLDASLSVISLLSIPAVIFVMIIWLCRDSEPETNKYGSNPKENDYLFDPAFEPIAGARAENPQEQRAADGPDDATFIVSDADGGHDDSAFIVNNTAAELDDATFIVRDAGGDQPGARPGIPPPPPIKYARRKFKWKMAANRPAVAIPVLILAAVLANWLYIETTRALTPVPPGTPDTRWYEANRRASAFTISTADELAGLAAIANGRRGGKPYNFKGKTVTLTADIDLLRYDNWVPIGDNLYIPFAGTFDGGSRVIRNLTVKDTRYLSCLGLFGSVVGGTVMNLGVENVNITGELSVGGIVGFLGSGSTVTNCYSTGVVSGMNAVGGLAGSISGATLANSYSAAAVSGTGGHVGGVVGTVNLSGMVANCYSTGAVSGEYCVGGVAGRLWRDSWVVNSYSTGEVSGANMVGGIVGSLTYGSYLTGSAALNSGFKSTGEAGRLAGSVTDNVNAAGDVSITSKLSDNTFFNGMKTEPDDHPSYKESYRFPGAVTAEDILADGTIGGRFTTNNGWTVENGKLPGLFGSAAEMPPHLR